MKNQSAIRKPQSATTKVGIVGFGTVGQGAARALVEHREEIRARAGFEIDMAVVCSRNIQQRDTSWLPDGVRRTADWHEVVASPDVDIVAELVGGTTVARQIVTAALEAGKPVVTANKNLIAEAGTELEALARGAAWAWSLRQRWPAASRCWPRCAKAWQVSGSKHCSESSTAPPISF